MSDQKLSYMQELDLWTRATVIQPLHEAITEGDGTDIDAVCADIKKAIREKVLESYKNGLKAQTQKPGPARKEQKYAQAKTR